MNRHDSRQWDAQNNINVYRREGSTVRLLHKDLEEIRRDLEKKNERLEKENKRLRDVLNEIYPVIAGMVISSQKRLEKEAEEHWNQYCHMILNALKGRRE